MPNKNWLPWQWSSKIWLILEKSCCVSLALKVINRKSSNLWVKSTRVWILKSNLESSCPSSNCLLIGCAERKFCASSHLIGQCLDGLEHKRRKTTSTLEHKRRKSTPSLEYKRRNANGKVEGLEHKWRKTTSPWNTRDVKLLPPCNTSGVTINCVPFY